MKKIISVFLIIATLVAMLPAGIVFAADENGNLTYVFGASAYGGSRKVFQVTDTLKETIGNIKGGDTSNTKTGSDKWKMWYRLGGAATQSVTAHEKGFIYFSTTSDSSSALKDDVHKNALVLQIVDVPEGVYVPALQNPQDGKQSNYGVTDLYLVSEETRSKNKWNVNTIDGINAISASAQKLGSESWSASADVIHLSSVNYVKNATEGTDFNKIAPKIDIDYANEETIKGNWWLIATVSSKPSEWVESTSFPTQVFGSFGNLTFTKVTELTSIVATIENPKTGHKLQTPEVTWMSDGNEIDGSAGTVKIEILENADNALRKDDNGDIWAVGDGKAKVRVTGTLAGISKYADVEISVIPDDAYCGVDAEYLFYQGAYEDTADSMAINVTKRADPISKEQYEGYVYGDYGAERPWGLLAGTASAADSLNRYLATQNNPAKNRLDTNLNLGIGEWYAFKVKVPSEGKYAVDVSGYRADNAGAVDIYMVPFSAEMNYDHIIQNIDKYKNEGTRISHTDFCDENTASNKGYTGNVPFTGTFTAEVFDAEELENGFSEYLMIIEAVSGKTGRASNFLQAVTLRGSGPQLSLATEMRAKTRTFAENEEILFDVIKVTNEDGIEISLDNAYIYHEVKSGSEDVIKINDNGDGVAALSEGSGTVVTTVVINGVILTKELEVTVDNDYKIWKAHLYADDVLEIGNAAEFSAGIELLNRTVVADGDILEIEISEESEKGVLKLSDDKLSVIAQKPGTAKVRARVSARGGEYFTDDVEITVPEPAAAAGNSFVIEPRLGVYTDDNYTHLTDFTEYTLTRNWIFHEFTKPKDDREDVTKIKLGKADANYTIIQWKGGEDDAYLAFKVKFPQNGRYILGSETYTMATKYESRLESYIIPVTDETEQELAACLSSDSEYYVGAVDFKSEKAGEHVLNTFGVCEVAAEQEYFVVYKVTWDGKNGKDGNALYLKKFLFTDADEFATAELTASIDAFAPNDVAETKLVLKNQLGEIIDCSEARTESVVYSSSNKSVVNVDKNGVITATGEGTATVNAAVTYKGISQSASLEVSVSDDTGIKQIFAVTELESLYVYGKTKIYAVAEMNSGNIIEIPDEFVIWTLAEGSDADCVEIVEDNILAGRKIGTAKILAVIDPSYKNAADISVSPIAVEVVRDANVNPQIYTLKERENATSNAAKYSWAKDEVRAAKERADVYLPHLDKLYDMMVPEGVFRYYHVGHKYDPAKFTCRYCGCDISVEYGAYGWVTDAINRPWKVQCPDCKRLFPSNDFGSFYKLGLSESGDRWDMDRALLAHHRLIHHGSADAECACEVPDAKRGSEEYYEFYGYGAKGGYLTNDLYSDVMKDLGVDTEAQASRWGVDDGLGYMQPYTSDPNDRGYNPSYHDDDGDGLAEYRYNETTSYPVQHTYIAVYAHDGIWYKNGSKSEMDEVVRRAINAFAEAFLRTGDEKYGRAGAILLDRVADLFPNYDWYRWKDNRGDEWRGTIVDPIWSTFLTYDFAVAYDAFIPVFNDPEVIEYLSQHGAVYEKDENGDWKRNENGELIPVNLKNTPGAVRKNIEDNLLVQMHKFAKRGDIWGNTFMHQKAIAAAAVALNRSPETPEMISWIMNGSIVSSSMSSYNTGEPKDIAGAALMDYLVGEVDSDGIPNENSPSYNSLWITNILGIADILYGYPLNPTEDLNDLFLNPKLRKMLSANVALTLGGYYTAQIGDTGSFAGSGLVVDQADSLLALKYVEDKRLAQAVYMFNGNKLDGLNGSIFDENPEKITDFIEKTIEEEGELNLSSDMLAGFGFAVLRTGEKYNSAASGTQNNTIRDVAMYFGATDGHGHSDGFNLFMSAFGLNIAPENGYPEQTGSQPNRLEWNRATLAHNTVTVNESKQNNVSTPRTTPYHFDDSGKVRLMDVGSTVHYTIDDYRRTVMMVDVDDENSYTVDFFHVKGGDDHIYSFHSQSDEITAISGFNSEPVITPMYTDELGNLYGTYAGADVKYGPDPTGWPNLTYPCGSTWLKNVRTYNDMENTFSWEYKVKDWRKKLTVNRDIRLRMTMLNDEPMEEVAFAVGLPPQKDSNADIGDVEYILVKNKGHNLDTTFTTVIEPYDASNKYIKAIEKVSMVRDENSKPGVNDAYSAVKITLENDRVDYIVYSTNNTVDYTIDGKLRFRGFAGVLSLDGDGNVIYRY